MGGLGTREKGDNDVLGRGRAGAEQVDGEETAGINF